ncbi:unnamed protein product [Arabidopsis arenosa]|uniref:Retrotransposon gag domain-containing protein n=1 Tax=Arabidopsis arenosa TaxID=38785 RepID=A0A8S2ANU3_ARAAE|nr:unnamed protein product [Arabidopsis arenosa]
MVRGEIRADEEGLLRDDDGQAYNEAGQRLDDQGIVIPEDLIVDDPNILNLAAPQKRNRPMTLGDYNRPDLFYANHSAIVPPPFQRHDFELKPAYFTLVGKHPFHGFSNEQPMDHIERFEDLVSSIKANGVSDDYLLCKLFPYSLAGEPASWLKQLKPGSLTNWQSIKIAFLNNFYDDGKSEELRNKGMDWRYQIALDAASNGNFNTRYPIDDVALIENLACSNSMKNADFERKKIAGAITGTEFAEVNAKLDSVHSLLIGKKVVHFAAEVENIETEEESEEGVFYIDGQGYRKFGPPQGNFSVQRFTGNQNNSGFNNRSAFQKTYPQTSSFQRTYGNTTYQNPPAPTPENKMETMLEQILEGQTKLTVEFNGKFDAIYSDLNGKIDTLNTHMKKLDVQVAQTVAAVKRQDGVLPGMPDANPKRTCNAILIRDGDDVWEELDTEDELELAAVEPVRTTPYTLVFPPTKPVYTPLVPFPRKRRSKQEIQDARCKAIMEKILTSIPKIHLETSSPTLDGYVKRLVNNGICAEEAALLTKDISLIVLQEAKKERKKKVVVSEHDYDDEPKDPLILGRAFLATAGATIDVKKGQISLDVCDVKMNFDMKGPRTPPILSSKSFSVESTKESAQELQCTTPKEPDTAQLATQHCVDGPVSTDTIDNQRYSNVRDPR